MDTIKCFSGRGKISVKLPGRDYFLPFSTNGELSLLAAEENQGVFTYRNGHRQRIDSFVESVDYTVEVACYDISNDVLQLLLRGVDATQTAITAHTTQPYNVVAGCQILLPHKNIVSLTAAVDSTLVAIPASNYTFNASLGLVTFTSVAGITGAVTFTYNAGTAVLSQIGKNVQLLVEALVTGVEIGTNRQFSCHLPKVKVELPASFNLVAKEFVPKQVKMQVLAAKMPNVNFGPFGMLYFSP